MTNPAYSDQAPSLQREREPVIFFAVILVIALVAATCCRGAAAENATVPANALATATGAQPSIVDRAVTVLVQVESAGQVGARGRAGELGLTQITPQMLAEVNRLYPQYRFTLDDRRDPWLNVVICKTWLSWARARWHIRTVRGLCFRWNSPATGRPAMAYRAKVNAVIRKESAK